MKKITPKVLPLVFSFLLIFTIDVGAVTISLVPDNTSAGPAGQFNIDVVLNNPSNEGLAGIGIWLKFDSNLLDVVDTDSGNWITTGTNILDGPYHGVFDLPGDSDNTNDAGIPGEIIWNATRSYSNWTNIYPSGTFASITFQAKGVLGQSLLNFDGLGTGGYPDTYVVDANGEQILTSASGTTLSVVPEPRSVLLLGSGLFGIFWLVKKKRDRIDEIYNDFVCSFIHNTVKAETNLTLNPGFEELV